MARLKKHQYKIMRECAIVCDFCNRHTTAIWKRGLPDILICFNCNKVYENMAGELIEEEEKQHDLQSRKLRS